MNKISKIKHDHSKTGKEELLACLEIGKLLTSTLNHKTIFEHIMRRGSELIKAQHWSLLIKDEITGALRFEIVVGADKTLFDPIILCPDEGIAPYVARTGFPMFVPDVTKEPLFNSKVDEKTGFTTRSIICIPLETHGKISGVIEIVNIEDMEFFSEKNYPILQILADYAAIAIENSRYMTKIEAMCITDEYTGLYNSRYMHDYLDRYFSVPKNLCGSIAVIFIDMDDFKTIVDTHGHLQGSEILKQIGLTIKAGLSGTDILIKYGGDEYIIILPGRNNEKAFELAQSVSKRINTTEYRVEDGKAVHVTASFGIASAPENATEKKELLIAADNALFTVKSGTKNGISVA
jgi:diguanylate cyclase (GGDEF)-like protein